MGKQTMFTQIVGDRRALGSRNDDNGLQLHRRCWWSDAASRTQSVSSIGTFFSSFSQSICIIIRPRCLRKANRGARLIIENRKQKKKRPMSEDKSISATVTTLI